MRITGTKTALILIALGLFIPIVFFPFALDYKPKVGLLCNLQHMETGLWGKSTPRIVDAEPRGATERALDRVGKFLGQESSGLFENLGIEPPKPKVARVGNKTIEFPQDTTVPEMEKVCAIVLSQIEQYPDRMRFTGWGKKYWKLPYKYFFVSGVVLVFVGVVVLVSSIESRR
jgi:hypothetical protein